MTKSMTYTARMRDRNARMAAIARWPHGLEAMKDKTGATMADFCKAHGLDSTHLNHILAGRRGATWETIEIVDAALRAVLGDAYPAE